MVKLSRICGMVLAGATFLGLSSSAAQAQYGEYEQDAVIAITRPSNESKVTFEVPGKVADIPVKEGQVVKKGQTLIQLEDMLEQKKLQMLEIEAASELAVEAEQKALENTRLTLKRKKELHARGAATDAELEEAQLAVDIAEIKLRKANEDLQLKRVERDAQLESIRQKRLDSKIDGIVARVDVYLGEVVDPREPACTVVQNDPLWVEFHLPAAQAAALEETKAVTVRYPQSEKRSDAQVIFLSPVVDAASDTRLVRLEMPNPQNRPAGLQMVVELPADVVAAGAAKNVQADARQ